uniref:Peroxin-14 n=1 Tax=Steinernema glaseri TaxID=37863 RepID=A0A1I7YVW3_9BILA
MGKDKAVSLDDDDVVSRVPADPSEIRIKLEEAQSETASTLPERASPRKATARPASHTSEPGGSEPPSKRARTPPTENQDYAHQQPSSSCSDFTQDQQNKAIDITARFIYEELSTQTVIKLVLFTFLTFPDEMPAGFASSYTPIPAAGTEGQKQHLCRMMATQFTEAGVGPGVEEIKKQLKDPQHTSFEKTPTVNQTAPQCPVPQTLNKTTPKSSQFNVRSLKELSNEKIKKLGVQADDLLDHSKLSPLQSQSESNEPEGNALQ